MPTFQFEILKGSNNLGGAEKTRGDSKLYCKEISACRPAVVAEAFSDSFHTLQANV
jgi:hypothetical protein